MTEPPVAETPLFQDSVPAGFPSPAQDYVARRLDLNEMCVTHPAATYFVRATGESMVDAGIFEGSLLVVDRSLEARHGDIVIAAVSGEYTVKRLCLHPQVRLEPMNPAFPSIVLQDEDSVELFGVVTYTLRGLR
nr:translesion error-prone DNA polymerase V autoproteolytic subunit [Nissabacter sp. SGAir0207]